LQIWSVPIKRVAEFPGFASGTEKKDSLKPLALQKASAAGFPQFAPHCKQTSNRCPFQTGLANIRSEAIGSAQVM